MKIKISHLEKGKNDFLFREQTNTKLDSDNYRVCDPLEVACIAELTEDMLIVHLHTKGALLLSCSRCLDEFRYAVDPKIAGTYSWEKEIAKDNLIKYVPSGQDEIDITELIQESLILSIPMKPMCSDECKGICPGCGANLNQRSCKCTKHKTDPRWSRLSKFLKP